MPQTIVRWICVVTGLLWANVLSAHELRPAIADLTTEGGTLRLEITLNAEAIVAGADLTDVTDTDETEQSGAVDTLRALEPEALRARFEAVADSFAAGIAVQVDQAEADQAAIPLRLEAFDTEAVGDVDLPRDSRVVLKGDLPAGAASLVVTWPARYGMLVLRQQGVDAPYTGTLTGGASSDPIAISGGSERSGWAVFGAYIPVGFDHIVPKGLDHILFVLGLFFLSTRLGPLVWQVSAFTLAHTVTLAMAVLGWVTVPGWIVEPIIAASIVYVGIENTLSDRVQRWRPAIVFGFGLLHGLGFASVLAEFGLPAAQVVPALIGFNIGVELGQLFVIALAFLIVAMAQRVDRGDGRVENAQMFYAVLVILFGVLMVALNSPWFTDAVGASTFVMMGPVIGLCVLCGLSVTFVDQLEAYRRFVAVPASLFIALVGAWWFVERVFL